MPASEASVGLEPDEAPSLVREKPPSPAEPAIEPRRPRVGRALWRGISGSYEYLGTVVIASALWIGLAAILGAGGSGLVWLVFDGRGGALLFAVMGGAVAAAVGTGPVTVGLFHHARRLLSHDEARWWELLPSIGRYWRRGLALAGLQAAVAGVLIIDALYFLGQEHWLLRLVGVTFLYPLLFWCGAAMLQWPLTAARSSDSLWEVVKKSLLLLLDNLSYSLVVAAALAGLTALCLVTRIGLTLAWAGTAAFLLTAALRELLPKYGLLSQESDE